MIEGTNAPADAPTGRDALIAELNNIPDDSSTPLEADAAEEAAPAETEAAEPEADAADTDAADESDPVDEPVKPAAKAAKSDPELDKRLEAINKAERRSKEELAKVRAELDAERKKLEPDLAELKAIRELKRLAKLGDPAALLKLADLSDDDADMVARNVYRLTKKAAENPANREEVARTVREREMMSKLEATEQRLEALQKSLDERDRKSATEREVSSYVGAASKAITDDTPIMRNMFSANPEYAANQVALARQYLLDSTGEVPDPADVLKQLEDYERNQLKARGIDPDLVLKAPAKKSNPASPETKAAKTLTNQLGKTTTPRSAPKDPDEEKADLVKALESGDFD